MGRLKRLLCIGFTISVLCNACQKENDALAIGIDTTNTVREPHLLLGNPSDAGTTISDSLNYLLEKIEFSLSYNKSRATANWVSWHLTTTWLGAATRQDNFKPDNALPEGWYKVSTSNYTNSGFDRGHLCPSADRTTSAQENSNTFLMTNIVPQAPKNNQQTWARLEDYCRDLVAAGNELYIVAGVAGTGGDGSKGAATTINGSLITVPATLWKVIVVLPQGTNDMQRIDANTRVIAVTMPNSQNSVGNWGMYRSSVNSIEQLTGYDFMRTVAPAIQEALEEKVDMLPIE